jgi:hypothetical protein
VIDEPKGHALEFWEFVHEHRHHSVHFLKRFDLGFEYGINWHHHPQPHMTCTKFAVKPPMPPAWAWVKDAHYHGKHVIDGSTYDLWRHHVGGVELEVAVSEHDASRPHYFMRRTPSEHRVYHLISWSTFQPNATWFTVPDVCKNATSEADPTDATDIIPGSSSSAHSPVCAIAASTAARIVEEGNGFDAASMLASSFSAAGITAVSSSSLAVLKARGEACTNGPRVGDVFFDGITEITSAAVLLDTNAFAECSAAMGGKCAIVAQRDFTGGCRRFC